MTTAIRARLGVAVRSLAILVVFLATAEAFARVDDAVTWGAPLLSPYTHDRLLLQDSLGFRGRPNYRYQKWRMNNFGFRGPDITPRPAPGVIRVAVVGASETFGLYETEGAEYVARMQALLDSMAPGRFEVINAALPGMSLSSMISYFNRVILPARPQMLLIYPSPSFYLEEKPQPVVYTPPRFTPPLPRHIGPWAFPPDFFEPRLGDKGREVLKGLVPTFVVTAVRQWRLDRARSAHPASWVWETVPEEPDGAPAKASRAAACQRPTQRRRGRPGDAHEPVRRRAWGHPRTGSASPGERHVAVLARGIPAGGRGG